jgi:hypothetical protein
MKKTMETELFECLMDRIYSSFPQKNVMTWREKLLLEDYMQKYSTRQPDTEGTPDENTYGEATV